MYVMLLLGMIVSAIAFGAALQEFSPLRLIQVIQACAVITLVLNSVAAWKQEGRHAARRNPTRSQPSFKESWDSFAQGGHAVRRLLAVGFGTMGFSMADVLLEPYGGQILGLSVGATTSLTATLAGGGLVGLALASRVLSRGADPFRMASYGALTGVPAFVLVIAAAPLNMPELFAVGTLLVGFGAGLFGHGTLTSTMNLAPRSQVGLALGAWGAAQAVAAGLAIATGGIIRDVVASSPASGQFGHATGYICVYALEIILLVWTLATMAPLMRKAVEASPEPAAP